MKKILLLALAYGLLITTQLSAQSGCPAINIPQKAVNGTYALACGSTCGTLDVNASGVLRTTSYTVAPITYAPLAYNTGTQILIDTDDIWSQVVTLPFRFCFFGNSYNTLKIGTNGVISFNTNATFNNWSIPGPAPFTSRNDIRNCIMAPWQDLDPSFEGQVFYEIGGVAPCYQVPMFGDSNSITAHEPPPGDTILCHKAYRQTQQIVIYETTNIIDIHIQEKEVCPFWNGGLAIEGIQNSAGTVAYTVPGRNATQWTATNSSHRFAPAGLPDFTVEWRLGTNDSLLSTNASVNVCPATSGTLYRTNVVYRSCGVPVVTLRDSVAVVFSGLTATLGTVQQMSCPNTNDGSVTATFNATTAVISYGWSPGGPGQTTLTGLGPGTYTFTVTDTLGCTQTLTATINTPPPFTVSVSNNTIISCTPGATAAIAATVNGGTPNYTYLWNNTAASTTSFINETAGTYTVTVTDANLCTAVGSGTITLNAGTVAFNTPTVTDATCGLSNGSITVSVTGAAPPVTYTWSGGLPNGSTQTNVAGGTYIVTATDANSCSASAQVVVGTTPALVLGTPTIVDATCLAADGSIALVVTSGTAPVNYTWSPVQPNNDTITGLVAGTYSVTAIDANTCSTVASYTVGQTGGISFGPAIIDDASCIGNDGSIAVTIVGATAPVNYTWSPLQPNNDTILNLAAGTYAVTAIDANGCSATASYTVGQATPISFGPAQVTNPTCTNDGRIIVTLVNATPPITYTWSGGVSTNDTASNLGAGTYVVTAIDANNCSATASYTLIKQPGTTFNTPVITDANCGQSNGSIVVSVSNATPPVDYTWSPAQPNNDTITNLAAGVYDVTATDVNGCSATASYTVNSIPISFGPAQITDAGCTNTGSIIVTLVGAANPVDYTWSPVQPNNDTITGLAAGIYAVTAIDANGCSAVASYTVGTTPNTLALGAPTVNNISCNGAGDGNITLVVNGGTYPYTYIWTPVSAGTDSTATGLQAGTYNVTVTDNGGCSATATFTIAEPSAIVLGTATITDVTCTVGGTITVTATGGIGTLTYDWSNGDSGTLADSLAAGTVTLTVTDANGCSITQTYTIGTAPNTLAFGPPTIVNVSCNGEDDGSITVTTTGGVGTVNYVWNTTPVQTTATISGLTAGTYNVTATDANGCSASATYNVTEPTAITLGTPTIIPATCTVGGSVTVTATGGTGTLDYDWSNGDSGTLADSISGGSVTLTVTDANGCSITQTYTVPVSSGVTLTATVNNISCNGAGDGNITLIVSGGTYPYTYTWSPVSAGTDSTATGLQAGNYNVTVNDNGGCSATGTYTIAEPSAITLGTATITDVTCTAGGTVTVTATGGTGTLTYDWSNGDSGTLADSLAAGTVTLTVTDANGCSITQTYTIGTAPNTLAFGPPTIVNVSCNGEDDGSITVTTTGSVGTVNYVWNTTPVQNTPNISGLIAGSYTVTATDANGCSVSATYNVTEPTAITLGTPTITPATCTVGGSVTVTATGGTGTLDYDWSNGDSGTLADSISSGSVTLTVTDANGCSITQTYTVPVSSGVTLTATVNNISCNGAGDGNITLIVSGGTYPYTYTWSPVSAGTDSTATGLQAGTYTVTVDDNGGCSATGTYTIAEPSAITLGTATITDVTCTAGGTVTVTATGGTGTLDYDWSNGDSGTLADSLTAGTVTLTVTDANGCSITQTYTIGTAPNTLAFGPPSIDNVTCNGGNNGAIGVSTTGGVPTITFVWNTTPVQNTPNISGLIAGSYTVTATDANGCSVSATYNVTEPTAITLGTPTITPATCTVGGSVTVTATGGTGTLDYDWSNGDSGTLADSISSGSVTLTVTDANGCSITQTYTVPVASGVTLTANTSNITCNGLGNGSITLIVSGGTYPYTYTWSPISAGTDSTATGLQAGNYSVTVNDNGGCSATGTYTIAEPSVITIGTPVITNQTCNTGGSVSVTATGGTGTLVYTWSNGDNGTLADSLNAGTVTLTVRDANGCSATASYNISSVGSAVAFGTPTLTQPTCNGGTNGSITVTTTGGVGTIVYNWNPGSSSTATLSGIGAGTYSVTATDSLGCTATATYTLGQPAAINLGTPVIVQATCQRGGSVTITPTGGTVPLTINWSNGDIGNTADSLAAGAVTVTVTDGNNCSATASYNISNSGTTIVFGTPIINNVSCNGASDGSITVNSTGGTGTITYTWANPVTVGTTVVGLAPGQYTVVATDQGGCSASATYPITQPDALVVVVGATPLICTGANNGSATAFVTGGTPNYTYVWNPNNGSGSTINNLPFGIVSVVVTDANGCTASGDSIIGQSTPLSYYTRIDQPSCSPFGTETLVPRDGTGAVRVQIPSLGVDTTLSRVGADSTLVIANIPAGNYTFTLTDALGCSTTGSFPVDSGIANQQFTVDADSTSCYGDGFNDGALEITALTPANAPYQYSLDGTTFQDSGIFNNLNAGNYNITVRNAKGCLQTIPATVPQPAQLIVDITPATTTTTAGTPVVLTANITNFGTPVYTWSPTQGLDCDTCDGNTVTATVSATTVYYVRVSEDSSERCFATDSAVIIITSDLIMPNAFSPNNDGKNDSYGPVRGNGSGLTVTAFRIYNRWGQEVHNSTENWNGKFKGEDQPAGTYIYYISAKTPDATNPGTDKTLNDQGSFTILR